MAAILATARRRLKDAFGEDSLEWFDRSYVFDWLIASTAWFIAWNVKQLPPFERDFDRKDTLINHKHKHNQISGNLNWTLSLLVPLAVVVVTGCLRRSALEIHHSSLALWSGRGYTFLFTELLKNRVGRLRPDFLSRCEWDKTLKACTGDIETVLDGRRSFPSGHSSTAFAGMSFLSLWIAGMTGAWCIGQPAPARSFLASKLGRLTISIMPLVFATWVAVSRIEDNRHHKEDVIVGGLIGATFATICYFVYWRNPFSSRSFETGLTSARARIVYRDTNTNRQGNGYDYELAGMEHANGMDPV
ncbi:hypothetical protein AcV7_003182 [Taiwanofungus camphoratus]|nr:hypothetical protein AcV7_003182 [Antrodia cinnamomea]